MATYYGYDRKAKNYYALPETPDEQPTPPGKASQPSAQSSIPHVRLAAKLTNPMDAFHSQQLLASTLWEGIYTCPQCGLKTEDKQTILEHLTEEINKSLTQLAQLAQKRPPAKA